MMVLALHPVQRRGIYPNEAQMVPNPSKNATSIKRLRFKPLERGVRPPQLLFPLHRKSLHILLADIVAFTHRLPLVRDVPSIEPSLDVARLALSSLTDVLAPNVLVPWSNGPIDVVVLACKAILARIAEGIGFITPVAPEVEPRCRRLRIQC